MRYNEIIMITATKNISKLNIEFSNLKQEVRTIRSLLISVVGEDKEGQYHTQFVREVLKAAKEKPEYVFKDMKSFLAELG